MVTDNMNQQIQKNNSEPLGTIVLLDMGYADESIKSIGTGFFVSEDKIATNVHVLAGAVKVTAKHVSSDKVYTVEGITAFDDINDLVVLKISEKGTPFPFADSDSVQVGDTVHALGYPEGKESEAEGIIQGIRNSNKWFRLKMPNAGPGYSGSPVLNRNGKVVAILNQFSFVEGSVTYDFGNAIPSNTVKALITDGEKNTSESHLTSRPLKHTSYQEEKKTGHDKIGFPFQKSQTVVCNPIEPLTVWIKRPRIGAFLQLSDGNEMFREGNQRGAIAAYNKAIKFNPDLAEIYHNRGFAKNSLGQYKQAIADYDLSLKLNPDSALSYSNRAASKIALKKYQGALEDCDAALRINPDFIIAHSNRAIAKISLDNYQEALDDANFVLQKHSDSAEAFRLYLMCSAAKSALGNFVEAIGDINKVISRNPNFAEAYVMRGFIKNEMKDYQGAIEDAEQTLQLNPKSAHGFDLRAVVKAALGESKVEQGDNVAAQGYYHDALENANKAIQLNPKSNGLYITRGTVKQFLGESKTVQGNIKEARKLYYSAIADHNKAIRLKPKSASAYNGRGWVKYLLGLSEARQGNKIKAHKNFQKAVFDSEEAIRFAKDSYYAYAYYHTHGAVMAALEDYEKAIEDFSKAIGIKPTHVLSYNDRGKAKEALGQLDAAKADYEKAKKLEAAD